MSDRWFYLDSSGTQFGPCNAAELSLWRWWGAP